MCASLRDLQSVGNIYRNVRRMPNASVVKYESVLGFCESYGRRTKWNAQFGRGVMGTGTTTAKVPSVSSRHF